MRTAVTNEAGLFRLTGLFASDTVQARARVLDADMDEVLLAFDKPGKPFASPVLAGPDWPALTPWMASATARQNAWPAFYRDSTARQLAEVVVRTAKPRSERPVDVQRSSLHGSADGVLVVDKNVAASVTGVGQLIMRLPGLQIVGGAIVIGGISSLGDNTPLYLIDGQQADGAMLDALNPMEVSRIELLKSATTAGMYGARGGAGVIAIYTHKGNTESTNSSASVAATFQGFARPREFYVPRYETTETASATDRRDVLFWEPLGQSGSDGLANLYFPLSDTAQRLRIVVQGITVEGVPISFTWVLPVR